MVKILIVDGNKYAGTRLYKTDESIAIYDGDNHLASMDGIKDWTGISWEGELDETPEQTIERLKKENENLKETLEDILVVLINQ